MAASEFAQGMNEPATFELSVRQLPPGRGFLVACGLEDAVAFLDGFGFSPDTIGYLRSLGTFDEAFLEFLAGLRFTGEVWAVPEGEAVFAGEPLLRVTAPLIEAQLAETFLLNAIAFQTMVATKAARIALACGDVPSSISPAPRPTARGRAQGRARLFVGGAPPPPTCLAGQLYGLGLSGTMGALPTSLLHPRETPSAPTPADCPRAPSSSSILGTVGRRARPAWRTSCAIRHAVPRGASTRDLGALRPGSGAVPTSGLPDPAFFASSELDEYRIARAGRGWAAPSTPFGMGRARTPVRRPLPRRRLQAGRGSTWSRHEAFRARPPPAVKQVYREERDRQVRRRHDGRPADEPPRRPSPACSGSWPPVAASRPPNLRDDAGAPRRRVCAPLRVRQELGCGPGPTP